MSTRLIAVLLAFAAAGIGEQLATPGRGDVRFSIDTALFRSGTDHAQMLEVYQEIPLDNLSRDADGTASFTTVVVMTGPAGDTLAYEAWRSETEWASGRSAINAVMLPVTPGERALAVTVTDNLNGLVGTAQRNLTIEAPGFMSEVEIARTLMPVVEGSENALRKGALIVFPAASNTFSVPAETRVYTYQELYDLGGTTLHRQTGITGPDGRVVFARPADTFLIPEGMNSVSLVDSLDLTPAGVSGLYGLYILYTSENGDTLGLSTKPMLVEAVAYLPELPSPAEAAGTPEHLDEFILLLPESHAELYESLDEQGRAAYYQQFWQNSPADRESFEERCREVERFSYMGVPGFRTDRGRVYIIYGEPVEVERSAFTTDNMPYESWQYLEGGSKVFVFADMNASGDFRQVYSNVPGEVSFNNWQDMIRIHQSTSGDSSGDDSDEW